MLSKYTMVSVIEVLDTFIRPHSKKILIVVALIIFSIVAYYFYGKWNTPVNKYKDIYQPNDAGINEAVIYFFFADWCPHCTNAKPEWTAFVNKNDGKLINGIKLRCTMVDCSDPELQETAAKIDQFGIKSYPTIKLVVHDNTYDFEASVTQDHLDQFVKTVIV